MLPNGRRLGAHLPLGNGMVRAADRAAEIGASAIQVFSDNPASWRRRHLPPKELPAFRDRLAELDITPIAIHAPYLINLASPDADFFERSVQVLANELRVAVTYGARYVNVHIGSHRGAGETAGTGRLIVGLTRVLDLTAADAPDVVLVFENGAGAGFGMGSRIEELARIDKAAAATGLDRDRFAYCLDTAHLWGAGYPIGDAAGVDRLIDDIDAQLGLDRLRMIHLNDSRFECGSHLDRHEHIGGGLIGVAGLARLVTHPRLDHIAYYLETPGMDAGYDAVNIARVKDLAAGRPLAPLPPEAFEVKSTRGRSAPADHDDVDPDR
jgi:deoxyribonuclease IV